MRVEFRKTGERRYGVFIERENFPNLEMNPAPGFDELMPHDLLHFLVEQAFDLRNGIFGQIASGGTAGTFRPTTTEKSNKIDSRLRKKTAKRGEKLLKDGLDDCAKSERATYICLHDWLSRSSDEKLSTRALEMKASVESTFAQMSESERKAYTEEKLAEIRERMDELSRKWFALKPSQALTLVW